MLDVKHRVTQADIADQKAEFLATILATLGLIILVLL